MNIELLISFRPTVVWSICILSILISFPRSSHTIQFTNQFLRLLTYHVLRPFKLQTISSFYFYPHLLAREHKHDKPHTRMPPVTVVHAQYNHIQICFGQFRTEMKRYTRQPSLTVDWLTMQYLDTNFPWFAYYSNCIPYFQRLDNVLQDLLFDCIQRFF